MFSIGIVAHEARRAAALSLFDEVGADYISIDDGSLGCGRNHLKVLKHLAELGEDHVVFLEDDAEPVPDFREQLGMVLVAAPKPVVSLYMGRLRPPQFQRRISAALDRADAAGAHWITANHLIQAVGVAIRTELVCDLLRNINGRIPIDQAIGRWAAVAGHGVAYCLPSIIQHADGPTLVQHPDGRPRAPGRVAWRVGTRLFWNSRSVELP